MHQKLFSICNEKYVLVTFYACYLTGVLHIIKYKEEFLNPVYIKSISIFQFLSAILTATIWSNL